MEMENTTVQSSVPESQSAPPSLTSDPSILQSCKFGLIIGVISLIVCVGVLFAISRSRADMHDRAVQTQDSLTLLESDYSQLMTHVQSLEDGLFKMQQRADDLETAKMESLGFVGFEMKSYSSGSGYIMRIPSDTAHTVHQDTKENRLDRFESRDALLEVLVLSVPDELDAYRYMDADHVGSYADLDIDTQMYLFKDGLCDSGVCSDPFVAVVARLNGKDIVHFMLYGDTTLSTVEHLILQSIGFNQS